jgi:hypothetical protein
MEKIAQVVVVTHKNNVAILSPKREDRPRRTSGQRAAHCRLERPAKRDEGGTTGKGTAFAQ